MFSSDMKQKCKKCPRDILSNGGQVFFTDINVENGEKTRATLAKEFGEKNVPSL